VGVSIVVSMAIPVIIVALIVFLVVGIRNNQTTGGEEMIKNVFIYLVLFATLMMTIGGSVGAFMALADIIAPTPYYQSFEDFKRGNGGAVKSENSGGTQKYSDEELKNQYDLMIVAEKERQASRATNSLIKSFGWIVIPFPVFMYFQKRITKKEEEVIN